MDEWVNRQMAFDLSRKIYAVGIEINLENEIRMSQR